MTTQAYRCSCGIPNAEWWPHQLKHHCHELVNKINVQSAQEQIIAIFFPTLLRATLPISLHWLMKLINIIDVSILGCVHHNDAEAGLSFFSYKIIDASFPLTKWWSYQARYWKNRRRHKKYIEISDLCKQNVAGANQSIYANASCWKPRAWNNPLLPKHLTIEQKYGLRSISFEVPPDAGDQDSDLYRLPHFITRMHMTVAYSTKILFKHDKYDARAWEAQEQHIRIT